nr:phosphatidylethanolamine-binding protein homolog F40A3.3-like [Onthophagus taurus]
MFSLKSGEVIIRDFSTIANSMKQYRVIPDVIDSPPEKICEVIFPSGAKANLGNMLTPTQVKDKPMVKWVADKNSFYTLCVSNPDVPHRDIPRMREWLHWLVGNIPGNEIAKGEILADYIGAGPSKGSGFRRYVYLIYRQIDKIPYSEKILTSSSTDYRNNFSIRKFADKYKLEKPTAGNFYIAEWDTSVPKLYKRLGFKQDEPMK